MAYPKHRAPNKGANSMSRGGKSAGDGYKRTAAKPTFKGAGANVKTSSAKTFSGRMGKS